MDFRDYGTLAAINMATPPDRVADYYSVTLVEDQDCGGTASSPGYCVSAAPKSGTTQEGDITLKLDHKGNKLPSAQWD